LYVSVNGSDTNVGTTPATAMRTIQKAHDKASCGNLILVLPGRYFQRTKLTKRCTSGAPLTIQGVRGSGGTFDTKVEGTDATSGWTSASPQCTGCYRMENSVVGYTPRALTVLPQRLAVMRLLDSHMNGRACFNCADATGLQTLSRSASNVWTNALGFTSLFFWDGWEALWGTTGGFTYLRFRNGENPNTMNVRVAPSGATFLFSGSSNVIVRYMEIGGGQSAVQFASAATNNTVTDNDLRNGENRVVVDGAGVNGNRILNNTIDPRWIGTTAGYAATVYLPGDWNDNSYPRRVASSIYSVNKFDICGSGECNPNITIGHQASNTLIQGNVIQNAVVGVLHAQGVGTKILNNVIQRCAAECVWAVEMNSLEQSLELGFNTIIDGDHGLRVQEMFNPKTLYVYGNHFSMIDPISGGKHIHLSWSPLSQPANSPAVIWIYHNTFTGRGWAIDAGIPTGSGSNMPCIRVLNNVISVTGPGGTRGISSVGVGDRWGSFNNNWTNGFSDSLTGKGVSGFGCTGAPYSGNIVGSSKPLWTVPPAPANTALPAGHAAKGSGLRLDQPFTLGGVTYPALPGMSGFYRGGSPDRGAAQ
jgi:hypothetical protein